MTTEKKLGKEQLEEVATKEISEIQNIEMQLSDLQKALDSNPQFAQFLEFQKKLSDKANEFWADIKDKMIENGVKKIEGAWGWITIGETTVIKVVDEEKLPKKFFTKQIDMQALKNEVQLKGKMPNGVEKSINYKIMKKIKSPEENN